MKLLKIAAAIAATAMAVSANAAAPNTSPITSVANAKLTVLPNCAFFMNLNNLDFGSNAPQLVTPALSTTATAQVKCTKGTIFTPSVSTSGVMTSTTLGTPETVAYTATLGSPSPTGTGLGFGTAKQVTVTINGSVTGAAYENVTPDAYLDNAFTLNIAF